MSENSAAVDELLSPLEKTLKKQLLKYAVQKTMFCPFTQQILDVRKAVNLSVEGESISLTMHGSVWDEQAEMVKKNFAEKFPGKVLEILDGRELHKRAPRKK